MALFELPGASFRSREVSIQQYIIQHLSLLWNGPSQGPLIVQSFMSSTDDKLRDEKKEDGLALELTGRPIWEISKFNYF